jgi:DNA-binding GntR family transcriptional regulator
MSQQPLRERAYEYIHGKIASGYFHSGSVLSEHSLAREIGISRTPVREAIGRLKAEGLVEQVPRFGTVVRTPLRHEIVEIFQLREALESYAAASAVERLSQSDIVLLEKLCGTLGQILGDFDFSGERTLGEEMLRTFRAADMGFHAILARAGGNPRMIKIIKETRVLTRIFGAEHKIHNRTILAEAYKFHVEILEAIKSYDAEGARKSMLNHIRVSLRETLDAYDQMQKETHSPEVEDLGLPADVEACLNRLKEEGSARDHDKATDGPRAGTSS